MIYAKLSPRALQWIILQLKLTPAVFLTKLVFEGSQLGMKQVKHIADETLIDQEARKLCSIE